MHIAIIGAGIAGLTCARALAAAGCAVTVFEKSRGPGGRISTRRRDGAAFDHGAQFFTVRDPAFGPVAQDWAAAGMIAPWTGRFGRLVGESHYVAETPPLTRWVGVPRMSAITRRLSAGLDVKPKTRIERVARDGDRWRLTTEGGASTGAFDRVVVATPAPQAAPLLAAAPKLAALAAAAKMRPSWAVMARFAEPVRLPFDAVDVQPGPVAWLARNSSKPGRDGPECWVLLARASWAEAHVDDTFDDVAAALVKAVDDRLGGFAPVEAIAHRWRYGLLDARSGPPGVDAHLDPSGLGACGDWCVGPRVESAWRSGRAMARLIRESATPGI